ncbi:MAG: copper resistance system multicopper oxidase [Gluconobacter sp.]|uniref:copper resistance system multicopper oxidase n=1 Tax=Gluconobacter sp. TaxID=1876758 RepID=UPI0039E832E1
MIESVFSKHAPIGRRRFVTGAAALGCGAAVSPALAHKAVTESPLSAELPDVSSSFLLNVEKIPVRVGRQKTKGIGINGSIPAPTLRWREGDTVELQVRNHLHEDTSIHWHGIRLPADMDGVPGLSFAGIPAGETFTYRFPVRQSGTYWYHSHSGGQEQAGLYGALVIDPADRPAYTADRDYVVLLSDWTDADPMDIVSNLKFDGDYYNFRQRTVGDFLHDVRKDGLMASVRDRLMWGGMNMAPTDISDVSGIIYTYLMNGRSPDKGWTGLFRPGERIRLRFINAASMTLFDVRIPGLTMQVVASDGNDVEPVHVDEFRIAPAETYDVIVQPAADEAYTIFVQSEDRTGYARGTLATREGALGAIPPMDPRPLRTMADMGMAGMKGMGMGMDGEQKSDPMAGMHMEPHDQASSGKTVTAVPQKAHRHAAMDHMNMGQADRGDMAGMEMGRMDMSGMSMRHPMPETHSDGARQSGPSGDHAVALPVNQPSSLKTGVEVQSLASNPQNRLGEAGDGLDGNGRRCLRYTDLRALKPGSDLREPSREIVFHLTGNMERFIWGFNGKKFSEAEPVRLLVGERVRFILINDTMMEHPIHLHGLWSELENGHGRFQPYKHTVNVKPGERLSYLVTADVPGLWAYHCHLLYHMDTGMFRTVVVA